MQESGASDQYSKEDSLPTNQPQMSYRQSNVSIESQISFNGQSKKQKSKSFNRKQGSTQQENSSILKIYRQLQYTPQIRNILKKFIYLQKQKTYRFSVTELKDACQKELKRIQLLKKNNSQIQRFLSFQEIQETDNELSIISLTCQIKSLVQQKNGTKPTYVNGTSSMQKTVSKQYENILLEVQKSDESIKSFINTHLKLPQPSDLNIAECKKFFKKQTALMSNSSDRIILSRKTLCEIIVFLCRLLQGQILAFQDVYEYENEIIQNSYQQTENGKRSIRKKTTKNKEVKVRNLDQSFSEDNSSLDGNGFKNKNQDWNDYSSRDLGLKVNQLAGICQQIPQLESFTRTLKFSKITLENRQSFFKIVQVIIALHHKIGYLSRNKPALMRQIEDIQTDLSQIYDSLRVFVSNIVSQVPSFHQISFKRQKDDSKHQLTQTLASLKKQLRKIADVVAQQNKSQQYLDSKIDLIKTIIQSFHQNISDSDQNSWQEFIKKLPRQIDEDQTQIINWLTDCFEIIENEIKNNLKNRSQMQTQRNLQAEVHTLLNDYEKIRAQNQALQGRISGFMDQKDQMLMDIEQRDKIITNLTNLKINMQKRQRSLRDELMNAQEDCRGFQQMISQLEREINRMGIENENHHKDLIYQHQDQINELVNKIAQLQRAKMQILQKYEQQCMKSINNLHGSNNVNHQLQSIKDRLEKKTRQLDDSSKKYKQAINNLQKQNQELKNQKSIIQNKLQYAQKNKNRLMQKLDEVNNKYSENVKDFQEKYEDQMTAMKQNMYKLEKQLQKYKRNNTLLSDQIQQLKAELTNQVKSCNQYRQKLLQFNTLQTQYEGLGRQYERLLENYQKSQTNNQHLKQKIFELSTKHQEYLQQVSKGKQIARKLQKKNKELEAKLQETITIYEGLDRELKEQIKFNKTLQKKISDLEAELQSLHDNINSKDKSHHSLLNKSELKYQQLEEEQQRQIQNLKNKLRQLQKQKQKYQNNTLNLEKQLRQISTQLKSKDEELKWQKKDYQKKMSQKDQRSRQVQEENYNNSILMKQLKEEKMILELRISQLQNLQKQKDELKKSVQNMQQNEHKLKGKIDRLEEEVARLYDEIQKLKQLMKQKQSQFQESQELFEMRQKQLNESKKTRQNETFSNQIMTLREQIINQKTIIIQQNKKLQSENNQLQDQIEKLRRINQDLEKNLFKIQKHFNQTSDQIQNRQIQFKDIIGNHLLNISVLQSNISRYQSESNGLKFQIRSLKKTNQQLKLKIQQKCKLIIEKDNTLYEKQLQKNNLEKFNKQLKYKIEDLQNTIENQNKSIQKLKSGKIKTLQSQIDLLNTQINDLKKKQEINRHHNLQLQSEIQRLKRENLKKYELSKLEKQQLDQYYQNLIKKNQNQHLLELNDTQKKTRKQTENQFNQLLIKQKQTFNNLSIMKMEQLGQMQRKYQKLIKEQRQQKNNLQQEFNILLREINQMKKNKSLNNSRVLIQEAQNNKVQEQFQKLKIDYDSLRRDYNRLNQDTQRLQKDLTDSKQQNSVLIGKGMESQHTISLLNTKINQLSINLESSKKSLQLMIDLQRQKISLERDFQKLKIKSSNDQVKINDYKNRIEELQKRINDLQAKITSYRNKQYDWNNNTNELGQKNRSFTLQINQYNLKINKYQQQIQAKDKKLKQKELQWVNNQEEFNKKIKNWQDKQRNYKQIQNTLARLSPKYQQQSKEWTQKQIAFKQQIDQIQRRIKQLQYEVQNSKKISQQSSQLTIEYTNLSRNYQTLEDKTNKLEKDSNQLKQIIKNLEIQKQRLQRQIQNLIQQKDNLINSKNLLSNQNSLLKNKNQQLNQNIVKISSELHVIVLQNRKYQTQINVLGNMSKKSFQIEEQMKKIREFYENQMKNLQKRLSDEFGRQKNTIILDFEHVLKQLNEDIKREQKKKSQWQDKYNRLLRQRQQNDKILQKLRKQNMLLSEHCKTYENKISTLQIDHKAKGNMSTEFESKYNFALNQKNKVEQQKRNLQAELSKLKNQIFSLNKRIFDIQAQRNQAQYDKNNLQSSLNTKVTKISQLQNENQSLKRRVSDLQMSLKNIENQSKFSKAQKQTQQNIQNQRLRTQLALTRQEMLRLHQIIKKKQQDFERQIVRLTDEKALLFKDNQSLANEHQNLKFKFSQLQTQIQGKDRQIDNLKHQNQYFVKDIDKLKAQLSKKQRQLQALNKSFLQIQYKEEDYIKSITNLSADNRKYQFELQTFKGRLTNFNQQGEQLKMNESRLIDQNNKLQDELVRLRTEVAIVKMQYERLNSEYNKLNLQIQTLNQQNTKLSLELGKQRVQNERIYHESSSKDQTIIHLKNQIDHLSNQINTKWASSTSAKGQADRATIELDNLRNRISGLQRQNQQLKNHLSQSQRINNGMNFEIQKGRQVMEGVDTKLKQVHGENSRLLTQINNVKGERQNLITILKSRDNQIVILKQNISNLQKKNHQFQQEFKRYENANNQLNANQSLNQSRSSINLVTKSYSYQGGQLTMAELNRLEEEIRRLIKQIQGKDKIIQKSRYQNQTLIKEVKILKQQIQLLSQGKTINIKGYTRITNPNDASLNTKGVIYTEYDIRQFKARISHLQGQVVIYKNRQTQLLRELKKIQWRETTYLEQIRKLKQTYGVSNEEESVLQMLGSPIKKTSFDSKYNQEKYPQSSTYRLHSGIQTNQNKQKYFLRMEGEQLRKIIERVSNSNKIMSSKVDQILENSRKISKDSLQNVLNNNQFNIPLNLINEIRDLIHQNKALIQTIRSFKQNREDVNVLIQEYIDPQCLTEFVHRILIYFSEVEEQSAQAQMLRKQLNSIRRNNAGGYYFTVLEQFTKYIIENNSIQIYKEQLRQKAKELLSFKQKFQNTIDSQLEETNRLLRRSNSRGSILSQSRGNYNQNPVNQQPVPASNGRFLIPSLITVNNDRNRASSHLVYTPYNAQLFSQSNNELIIPRQSINQSSTSRTNVAYITSSSNSRATTVVTNNNANIIRPNTLN